MGEKETEQQLRADIRSLVHADASHDEKRRELIARAADQRLAAWVPENWRADGSLREPREQRDSANDVFAALDGAVCDAYCEQFGSWSIWVSDWYGSGTDEDSYMVVFHAGGDLWAAPFSYGEDAKVTIGEAVKVRPVTQYVERKVTRLVEWRKKKADELRGKGLERRSFRADGLELREKDPETWTLTGYASVTEEPYEMGFYTETIKRGAFKRTLAEDPDVQLLINHEGLPLARTKSGTLRLEERERGLWVEADIDKADPDAIRLKRKMDRGDLDEMSFAFQVTGQEWNDDFTDRAITAVSIHRGDVSIVNYGANPATVASMRSQAAIDTLRGIGGEGLLAALVEWRDHTLLPIEKRADETLSAETMEVLSQVLNLIAAADDAVDGAQPLLAELMGVPNPDVEDEADESASADDLDATDETDERAARAWTPRDYVTRARQELDMLDLAGRS